MNFITLSTYDTELYYLRNKLPFISESLRNIENQIINEIQVYNYFSPSKQTKNNISILDYFLYFMSDCINSNDISNFTYHDFYKKYIPLFIFKFIYKTYLKDKSQFNIINENELTLIIQKNYDEIKQHHLNLLLHIFGYDLTDKKTKNQDIQLFYNLNINNIYRKVQKFPIYDTYNYNLVLDNEIKPLNYLTDINDIYNIPKYYIIKDNDLKYVFEGYIQYANQIDIRFHLLNIQAFSNMPLFNKEIFC